MYTCLERLAAHLYLRAWSQWVAATESRYRATVLLKNYCSRMLQSWVAKSWQQWNAFIERQHHASTTFNICLQRTAHRLIVEAWGIWDIVCTQERLSAHQKCQQENQAVRILQICF